MLTKHYTSHPLFLGGASFEVIQQNAVSELRQFLNSPSHQLLLVYLLQNWYGAKEFMTWGYRNEAHGIPMTRTTMVVESHWRVLKTRFLSLHNRPRLDFVTHILNTQVIPKYIQDYRLYLSGLKKGEWWRRFSKMWKELSSTPANLLIMRLLHNGGALVHIFKLIHSTYPCICARIFSAHHIVTL